MLTKQFYEMPKLKLTQSVEMIPVSQEFFTEKFPTLIQLRDNDELNEEMIIRGLYDLCRDNDPSIRAEAGLCLRCFIAQVAKRTIDLKVLRQINYARTLKADLLSIRFDFYSCVLDDDGKLLKFLLNNQQESSGKLKFLEDKTQKKLIILDIKGQQQAVYKPFSFKVLETFDINRTNGRNFSNWTELLVLQTLQKSDVWKECGFLPRVSLWGYLSKVTPKQVRTLEEQYSNFSQSRINTHEYLIKVLRTVHQSLQFEDRQYTEEEKLKKMFFRIQDQQQCSINSLEELKEELKKIRKFLLEYKFNQPISLDQPIASDSQVSWQDILPDPKISNSYQVLEDKIREKIQQEGQPIYEQYRMDCLKDSIKAKISDRINHLETKGRKYKPSQYISGLKLFYQKQLSTGDIAHCLGFNSQSSVSRLLELFNLIEDSKRKAFEFLETIFTDFLKNSAREDYQIFLDEGINIISFFKEPYQEIAVIFQEAQAEIYNPKSQSKNSLFSQTICSILDKYFKDF